MADRQPIYVFADGRTHPITASDLARFYAKVDKTPTCWLWTARLNAAGYGDFSVLGRQARAHRFAYFALVGVVPEGLVLDHLCRVRRCVNPAHLEPVTLGENTLRGETLSARNAAVTHCPAGHPYDDANTYWSEGRAGRRCKECNRVGAAASYAARIAGDPPKRVLKKAAECRKGHPFTPENTYIDAIGKRKCRTCMRVRADKYAAARRAGQNGGTR